MDELWQHLSEGRKIPSKAVMFTIDDGFFHYQNVAARIFDEFGFPLNFFVITGMLDQKIWPWDHQVTYAFEHSAASHAEIHFPSGVVYSVNLDKRDAVTTMRAVRSALKTEPQGGIYGWMKAELYPKLEVDFPSDIPEEYRPMSWDDARSLRTRGHGVYPHTQSHRILSMLSLAEKREEIRGSLKRVVDELAYIPQVFAYPTGRLGDYDGRDIEELKQTGFSMAFNTVAAYVMQGQDHYQLPRFSLPEDSEDFLQIINRFEALKQTLRR
ncbi:hypothetical protein GCM10011362_21810 [Marinobacter halophilus]|nr:hypothetical protein GCM10011362_21810 [Marinobacter halophilus]